MPPTDVSAKPSPSRVRKITRNRPITSCSECTRRKQKCSKTWPCTLCLARKSPHLCRFANSSTSNVAKAKPDKVVDRGSAVPSATDLDVASRKASDAKIHEVEDDLRVDSSDMVIGTIFKERADVPDNEHESSENSDGIDHDEITKWFPPRDMVDLLIQHFLSQVNWLAEEVHAASFLERYHAWWKQPVHNVDTDIQFGILVLRLCINALQFLPHPNGPDHEHLKDVETIDKLENTCMKAATKLNSYERRRPSILRVQHLLFHIVTLLNNGNARESYSALAEAIKVGQALDLFLESRWKGFTEFEAEERRRVFWYLYVWDRFHCTYLGKWPLIPEHYHSVNYPSETPYVISPLPEAPTQFTDVFFNFKMVRHMASITCAPAREHERFNPVVIASHAKAFETEFLSACPPCLRFDEPDTSWDTTVTTLAMKRQALYIMGYGTVIAMHKCFVGPLTSQATASYIKKLTKERNHHELIRIHRHTLANACIKAIQASLNLLDLMGSGPHRWFVLSVASIEVTAMLGMLIISDHLMKNSLREDAMMMTLPLLNPQILTECVKQLKRGMDLNRFLAKRSGVAQKGTHILQGLQKRVEALDGTKNNCPTKSPIVVSGFSADMFSSETPKSGPLEVDMGDASFTPCLDNGTAPGIYGGAISPQDIPLDASFTESEWEAICIGNDFSWFFDANNFPTYDI